MAMRFLDSVVRVFTVCELEASNIPTISLSTSRRQRLEGEREGGREGVSSC